MPFIWRFDPIPNRSLAGCSPSAHRNTVEQSSSCEKEREESGSRIGFDDRCASRMAVARSLSLPPIALARHHIPKRFFGSSSRRRPLHTRRSLLPLFLPAHCLSLTRLPASRSAISTQDTQRWCSPFLTTLAVRAIATTSSFFGRGGTSHRVGVEPAARSSPGRREVLSRHQARCATFDNLVPIHHF